MNRILVVLLVFYSSLGLAQERVIILDSLCTYLDQRLTTEQKSEFKSLESDTSEYIYYNLSPEVTDLLDSLGLNDWEGEIHDSLRSLAPDEFISDFLPTKEIFIRYYIGHLTGNAFDVSKKVTNIWHEEIEGMNIQRQVNDSIYNSFEIGDTIFFIPSYIALPQISPLKVSQIIQQPYEVIPAILINKIDSIRDFEVVFLQNLEGIKRWEKFISKNNYSIYNRIGDTVFFFNKIEKNKPVLLDYYHFQKTKPVLKIVHFNFTNDCYVYENEMLHLFVNAENQLVVMDNNIEEEGEVANLNGNIFQYKNEEYQLVYDKNRNIEFILKVNNSRKYLPSSCESDSRIFPTINR